MKSNVFLCYLLSTLEKACAVKFWSYDKASVKNRLMQFEYEELSKSGQKRLHDLRVQWAKATGGCVDNKTVFKLVIEGTYFYIMFYDFTVTIGLDGGDKSDPKFWNN